MPRNGTEALWDTGAPLHLFEPCICTLCYQASLSGGFMIQFPTHPYFGNSAEEFHPHETLIISHFINTVPHQHI
jgi:hypothetical protein